MGTLVGREFVVEEARMALAGLLDQLQTESADRTLRLEAATMANRLALFHGDPSLADVAESLAIDIPEPCPDAVDEAIRTEAAVAKATRRAIALANAQRLTAPRDLVWSLVEQPAALAGEIRRRLESDDKLLARAILEVALTRHPDSDELRGLEAELVAVEGARASSPSRAASQPRVP
jgi:hypothetical protein